MDFGYLFILPIVVSFFWAIRLLTKKKQIMKAQVFGAISLFIFGIMCVYNAAFFNKYATFELLFVNIVVSALFAPIYQFFVRLLTDIRGIQKYDYLMFIPWVVFTTCYIIFATELSAEDKEIFMQNILQGNKTEHFNIEIPTSGLIIHYFYWIIPVQLIWIMIWGTIRRMRYTEFISDFYANVEEKSYHTISRAVVFAILTLLSVCLIFLMPHFKNVNAVTIHVILIFITIFIAYDGWLIYSLRYSATNIRDSLLAKTSSTEQILDNSFENQEDEQNSESKENDVNEMIEFQKIGSIFNPANNSEIAPKNILPYELLMKIKEENMFTDPELNLVSLAEKLRTNRTYLSQSIKYHFHTNLSGLIKHMRVEFVIRALNEADVEDLNLRSIAYSAGYNNMTSFYRDFSSTMGMSPKQYALENAK